MAGPLEIGPAARTQESVGAYLGEAARQDVLEEPSDEGVHRQRFASGLTRARVGEAEGDAAEREALEAVVGEGHAVDVAREVARGVLAASDLLHMHGPGSLPDRGIDVAIEAGAMERVAQLHAEDRRKCVAGQEKAPVGRLHPRRPVRGEPARGDKQVRVGVVVEPARPSVEDRQDAGRAADPGPIGGDGLHSGGRFAQQEGVDALLVCARYRAELLWEREGEEVVIAREEARAHALEPILGPILLALGAMAIATGVIGVVERAAVVAPVEGTAERARATAHDVVHRATVRGQHPVGVGLAIPGTHPRKMSASSGMEWRGYPSVSGVRLGSARWHRGHQPVDRFERGIAEFAGEMGVDRGGPGTGVAEVVRDQAEVDAGFEEMGGVAVAERVHVGALAHAALLDGAAEGALEARAGDGPTAGSLSGAT